MKAGLVASLNRPGGNITGVGFLTSQLESKRLDLLHELVPRATAIAVLLNPTNANAEDQSAEVKEAARTLGLQVHIVNASGDRDFDSAFAAIARTGAGALLVAGDPLYSANASDWSRWRHGTDFSDVRFQCLRASWWSRELRNPSG